MLSHDLYNQEISKLIWTLSNQANNQAKRRKIFTEVEFIEDCVKTDLKDK